MTEPTFPPMVEAPAALATVDNACQWLGQHRSALLGALAQEGALLLRGFPLRSAEDFDRFSGAFGFTPFTYEESLSNAVRINKTPRVFTANEAPPEVNILLHHEMAQTPFPPEKLFFFCQSAAEQGGETPLCRSDVLYRRLSEVDATGAAAFEAKGVRYTTRMPGQNEAASGQGRSWGSTLRADSRAGAEQRLEDLGYDYQWLEDDALLATSPVLPAVDTLPDGRKTFFNQVIAAGRGWKAVGEGKPPPVSFGDGTLIPEALLETVVTLAEALTVPLRWQDGDLALIDNRQVMHGRFPYAGARKREVLVALTKD